MRASSAYDTVMTKKRVKFTDEIRQAVEGCGLSRYRICQQLGVAQSTMSRFMAGSTVLSLRNLDALAELLNLHLTAARPRKKKG